VRPSTKYLKLWLEQARWQRNITPFDRASVDLEAWESMLVELLEARGEEEEP
jgi:hypothetical protein